MAEFPLEPQWLEMLNEANEKAQNAIFQRDKIHLQHRKATEIYSKYDKVAKRMEKESESAIKKCEDYFHVRDEFERLLEENGKHLRTIEVQLVDAKASLTNSLQQLGRQRPRAEDEASRTVSPQIRSSSSISVVTRDNDFNPFDEWIED
ncbi:unnamed protein product [Oikopleura dioica]|uniref:Uncharacterized protein n=1 Tax=Oikopleura dioica TaxID=34765 RepID=E4X6P3_OIKDI|nr:unnamed protein product [Oikopleura dioica]